MGVLLVGRRRSCHGSANRKQSQGDGVSRRAEEELEVVETEEEVHEEEKQDQHTRRGCFVEPNVGIAVAVAVAVAVVAAAGRHRGR